MLDVLYTGDYTIEYTPPKSLHDIDLLMKHLHVYALADRVQISNLKQRAESYIQMDMGNVWNLPGFCDAIQSIYDSAPPGERGDCVRRSALAVCALHAKELFQDPKEKFETLVANLPEFAMDLLKWQATHLQPIEYGGSALFGGGGSEQR